MRKIQQKSSKKFVYLAFIGIIFLMIIAMSNSVHAIGFADIKEETLEQDIAKPTKDDNVKITVNITYPGITGTVRIHYKVDSGSWKTVDMNLIDGNVDDGLWQGTIPKQSEGSKVRYYVNVTNTAPSTDLSDTYSYTVKEEDDKSDDEDDSDLQIDPLFLTGGVIIGGIAIAAVVVGVVYLQKRT